ncbi:hypothetical protein ACHMW7_00560 (plasmid) [Aminobacter sp. UC22_36]|uniref:hypothetical protein n=1 Tax=Aminobacter sp. UC22_36 TaxID=3374549 RepID=UPI003757677C
MAAAGQDGTRAVAVALSAMNVGTHRISRLSLRATSGAVELTRAELHQLVWSRPMTEIAVQLGVRDQQVAQACDRHDIARPMPGHWQKLQYGKGAEIRPLSTESYAAEEPVVIAGRAPFQHGRDDRRALEGGAS